MKSNLKKIILFTFANLFFLFTLVAQVSLDPNDRFYVDAKNWETKGIISWLPQIRPYSISTVKKILDDVKLNGEEQDVKLASYYEQKYFSKNVNFSLSIANDLKISNQEDKFKDLFYVNPKVYGDIELFNLVGLGYKLGVIAQNANVQESEVLAYSNYSPNDTHGDAFSFASADAFIDMTANLTIGKDNLYGMFGINKIAYGPFIGDSVLLNGNQFHSGNFSLIYEGQKWGYTQVFSALSRATKNASSGVLDCVPEKFMAFHSIRFTPIKQIAITYFESSIFTNRFDPCYFLPVPYMMVQGMYGASDNAISGLTLDFRPVDRLGFSVSGVIDDIDLNSFAKMDFGARFRFAVQTGVNYVPKVAFIDNVSLDYTIVSPYTYSHSDPQVKITDPSAVEYYNKDNFTNRLTNLGTRIPPNSDRIQLKVNLSPIERLKIDVAANFIRHANIAESFTEEEAQAYLDANNAQDGYYFSTDGSIWTSPLTNPSSTRNDFMKQEHKMYVIQTAINIEYELERQKWGLLAFSFGYMFEYIYNKGVDSEIYMKNNNGLTPSQSKQIWIDNFKNVFNNYFCVSLKYCY